MHSHPSNFEHQQLPELSERDFERIRKFVSLQCGIMLGDNKHYLVKNRLLSLLTRFKLNSYKELTYALDSDQLNNEKLKIAVIDAITTNETFWFRDEKQFALLQEKIFPDLFAAKSGPLKIWSAACSTGQEPYSISMTALAAQQATQKFKEVHITGTDISETVLTEAKEAVYSQLALSRGLDTLKLNRFFIKSANGFVLSKEVRDLVSFQSQNLLKPFSGLEMFDIIFCRNVLIYFSELVKRDIIARMANSLERGGFLFLSSTETLPPDLPMFERLRSGQVSYYRKIG